ncbi:histidine kinase [Bermanella sp. R86510]|uniref:histidine kinase n=1 Tax=unclassified Bermanella TaxID=2627862 RepID=UPI0037CBF807
MLVSVKNSIVFRIGILLTAMTVMAVVSMFSSFIISEMADTDAAAINVSGSLRKQSYLILSQVLDPSSQYKENDIKSLIHEFDEMLDSPVLENNLDQDKSQISKEYQDIKSIWRNEIKPQFEKAIYSKNKDKINSQNLVSSIGEFVNLLDGLVLSYQHEAESKIKWLRIIQIIALFFTLLIVYIAMSNISNYVEQPLKLLTDNANRIKKGDLESRIDLKSEDEFGVLAEAFNAMGESLKALYNDLEYKVDEKTKALKKSNDSMTFLFEVARSINEDHDNVDFRMILDRASEITGLGDMDLCLSTPKSPQPYIHMLTIEEETMRSNCDGAHCDACVGDSHFSSLSLTDYQIKFPLLQDNQNYGLVNVRLPRGENIDTWQHNLIQSVADQIAVALSLRNQSNQERRVALLNERTIIARELHDSLAQSLSYLKIQVTRLQKAHDSDAEKIIYQELIDEVREGLAAAYRQLRELLATFRLKVHGDGVRGALLDVIKQLRERSDILINFKYDLDKIPLSPNEEIHLLQVAKEALQNAVNHSKGSEVTIELTFVNDQVVLKVCDDGVGIPDDPEKLNHYGLAIMKERSKHVDGILKLYRQKPRGTCVEMCFSPIEIQA